MMRYPCAEVFGVGFWLGLAQVSLGFHLLLSQGAGVTYYLSLLCCWLAGSLWGTKSPGGKGRGTRLVAAGNAGCLLAALLSRQVPFAGGTLLSVVGSAVLCGAYAGWFLQDRAKKGEVDQVLFWENNGFVCGYAVAGCLVFLSIPWLNLLTFVVGVTVVMVEWGERGAVSRG